MPPEKVGAPCTPPVPERDVVETVTVKLGDVVPSKVNEDVGMEHVAAEGAPAQETVIGPVKPAVFNCRL